eukprot:TRINITY_DN8337_c0_g1_i1.p1 TRINITY_DN8337_c0_g1~~TRINITY_DN8337_c0_g1_i1.p1  ORF type:complete len:328 (-),score=57.30 TRINITY_DN8337_c0_g1_i1:103-1086(-)
MDEKYIINKTKALGEGAFGVVYGGTVRDSSQQIAVKKIRMMEKNEGISFTALREISVLQEIRHPNIVKLIEAYAHKGSIYLVFEFMETDLAILIKNVLLSPADIKSCMHMILTGVEFLHKHWILHRDLKPDNILIDSKGVLKLADFGLARAYSSPDRLMTSQVVTRWYRAPELLYGARLYGYGVDIWAVGCIFAELMLRRPYLPGDSDLNQLAKIFAALGTPTEAQWPGMSTLPDFIEFKPCIATPLSMLFTAATPDTLDLLAQMLKFDPNTRCTATEALNHTYFNSPPAATPPEQIKIVPKTEQPSEKKRPGVLPPVGDNVRRKIF